MASRTLVKEQRIEQSMLPIVKTSEYGKDYERGLKILERIEVHLFNSLYQYRKLLDFRLNREFQAVSRCSSILLDRTYSLCLDYNCIVSSLNDINTLKREFDNNIDKKRK